jgi:hypothetical protein
VVDPLSHDLFVVGICTGFAADPKVRRIHDPGSASPSVSIYATLYDTPGYMSFAPDGTLYVGVSGSVARIDGTDKPFPPSVTAVPAVGSNGTVAVGEAKSSGAAKSLLVQYGQTLYLVDNPEGLTRLRCWPMGRTSTSARSGRRGVCTPRRTTSSTRSPP